MKKVDPEEAKKSKSMVNKMATAMKSKVSAGAAKLAPGKAPEKK